MDKFYVNFNGVDIPEFVKVKAVNTTVLPEISHSFKTVSGRLGAVETGTTIGSKKISLDIVIVVPEDRTLLDMERELAYWLKGDNFKTSKLVISDECSLEYNAKVSGSPSIKDSIFSGEGSIEFVVPDGLAHSRFKKFGAVNENEILVDYLGTGTTFPIITFTPAVTLKNEVLRLTHVEKGVSVILNGTFTAGDTITIDCTKRVVKLNGVLSMGMIDLASDWLNISDRDINTFRCNLDGELSLEYKETWL